MPRPDARTILRNEALESSETSSVLWAAGDLLRQSEPLGDVEAREALARMTPAAACGALAAIDASVCARALSQALESAFDAGLEEDAEVRERLEQTAMDGLEQRDVVDCVLCAVATFDGRADLDSEEAASLREAASVLRGAVVVADAQARPKGRSLTALNARRRERADVLDDVARATAWWWSDFAGEEHDGLVELLGGLDVDAGEAATRDAVRSAITSGRDALGAALRVLDVGGPAVDDAQRWARSAAARSEADAIAFELSRTLRVEAIDDDAQTPSIGR